VIYYSAITAKRRKKQPIGAAVSSTIAGPYTLLNATLACISELEARSTQISSTTHLLGLAPRSDQKFDREHGQK
jgi:hypothetical protein